MTDDSKIRRELVEENRNLRSRIDELEALVKELEGKITALGESEKSYRDIVENCIVGIYRSTPEGKILFSNNAIVEMFGYEAFNGYSRLDLEKEGYDAGYPRSEFLAEMEREGEVRGKEVEIVTRDGTRLKVRENARAIRGEDGKVIYYEGTMEDMTDRRGRQ